MNKHKIIITLFFMGLSLFFINPISAQFINGDFETGLQAPWYFERAQIQTESPYNGTYHAKTTSVDYQSAHISQAVNLTDWNTLSFYIGGNMGARSLNVRLNGGASIYFTMSLTSYQYVEVNISSYEGIYTVGWFYLVKAGSGYIYLDDIELKDYTGYVPPAPSEISFYPSNTNITPTNLNYSVGALDETNDYFIITARIVDNETYWLDYIWLDDIETGSPVLNFMDYGSNCTYYAELHNDGSGNMIVNTSQEFIFNASNTPEFPDPDPTPNITPLPTYTPPPTPIPPENPGLNNSLNNTWTNNYFNLVNGVLNGLFNPIYNFTSYTMSPIKVLALTVGGFSNHMSEVFIEVLSKVGIATSSLSIIINSIPDKLSYVMIYFLLWSTILLIMKGNT